METSDDDRKNSSESRTDEPLPEKAGINKFITKDATSKVTIGLGIASDSLLEINKGVVYC